MDLRILRKLFIKKSTLMYSSKFREELLESFYVQTTFYGIEEKFLKVLCEYKIFRRTS